jgi:hypothetical protein
VTHDELVVSVAPWKRLFAYLDLDFDESQLESFSKVSLPGRFGDPTGQKIYQSLSTEPLDKWKRVLASPVRKAWCRRYLRRLGADRLRIMGYELDTLLQEMNAIPTGYRTIVSDLARMLFGVAFRLLEPVIARDKFLRLRARRRVCSHS